MAVVTFFGKIVRQKTEPGLGLRWPWPIETVYKLDQRIQNFESKGKFEEIRLGDQNIILLEVYVGWRIDDPKQFFPKFLNGSIAVAEDRLQELVRNAKNEVAGKHVLSDFISTDEKQMKFPQVEAEILKRVQQDVAQGYGLEVKFLQIKKIGLPESVTRNVFDRMSSERQFYISQIESSGEEAATKIKSKADSDAAKLLSDADAQAYEIRGHGEEQMMHSLQILQQNTNLANLNMQIGALTEMLKDRTTLILDQSTAPLNLLQPLPPQKFEATNAAGGRNP